MRVGMRELDLMNCLHRICMKRLLELRGSKYGGPISTKVEVDEDTTSTCVD